MKIRALLHTPPARICRVRGLVFCRNVLSIRPVMCLLMSWTAETIPTVGFNGSIGLLTPTTVFLSPTMIIHFNVTPKIDLFLDPREVLSFQ